VWNSGKNKRNNEVIIEEIVFMDYIGDTIYFTIEKKSLDDYLEDLISTKKFTKVEHPPAYFKDLKYG
jgi:hypothetical protein